MFEVICHLITGEIVNNIIYKIKLKIVKTPSDGKVHMLEGYDSNMYEYVSEADWLLTWITMLGKQKSAKQWFKLYQKR